MKKSRRLVSMLVGLVGILGIADSAHHVVAAPAAKAKAATALVANGRPTIARRHNENTNDNAVPNVIDINAAASLVELDLIPNQPSNITARLFGMAGGDPAANGLYTYISFWGTEGPIAYYIGDILEYRILAASRGRVDLEIKDHVVASNGDVRPRTRKVIVTWTIMANQDTPEFVTITPAR